MGHHNKKRHLRVEGRELYVSIKGMVAALQDVSHGGARIAIGSGGQAPRPGDIIACDLLVDVVGLARKIPCKVQVVRVDATEIAVHFLDAPFSRLVPDKPS